MFFNKKARFNRAQGIGLVDICLLYVIHTLNNLKIKFLNLDTKGTVKYIVQKNVDYNTTMIYVYTMCGKGLVNVKIKIGIKVGLDKINVLKSLK